MLTPQPWNLVLYPGLQFDPLFVFYEDTAKTQPFPLAGYSAQLQIGNGLLVLTDTSGLTLGASDGTVQAFATGSQTAAFSGYVGQRLPWSLVWTPTAGQPDCPAAGQVLIQNP